MGWGSTDTRLINHDIVPPVALRAWRDPAPLAKAIGGINPIRAPRRKGASRQDPKNIFAVVIAEKSLPSSAQHTIDLGPEFRD